MAVHDAPDDPVDVVRAGEEHELADGVEPPLREPAPAEVPDPPELGHQGVRGRHGASLVAPGPGQPPPSQRRPCSKIRSGAKRVVSSRKPCLKAVTRVQPFEGSTQPPWANQ